MRILYKGIITGAAEHFLFIRLSDNLSVMSPPCPELEYSWGTKQTMSLIHLFFT